MFWPDFAEAPFRRWAVEFGSALMGRPLEFWYDQLLAKPPHKSVATAWHQDEGYWGRNLDDKGITCWMPFHDVDPSNGCMHFIDGGHLDGVLEHRNPPEVQSDLLVCEPDEARSVACPIRVGSVTFHHSKTPHMTTANVTDSWRRILTQHLRAVGAEGEGDHYPWKVYVNQVTGERTVPESR
jgi:ectoine hydroxylase-related dioxygenase (phytanoyl-CoA dioxygenase family)